jgi:hypothetical protein
VNIFNHKVYYMSNVNINPELNFSQLVEAVKQLSPEEKLKLNDVLWNESIEIPEEHQALVLGRIEKAKQHPERLLDWDEASIIVFTE